MTFEVEAIGFVESSRTTVSDDDWGGAESSIVLAEAFGPEALDGLEEYSHAEIVFVLDRIDPAGVVRGARHPRDNQDWPAVGIFAQRAKRRPNRIGCTICRILRREGRRLYVAELDAIDGTPVLDIKPLLAEFLPREPVRQPPWSRELMRRYWATPPDKP